MMHSAPTPRRNIAIIEDHLLQRRRTEHLVASQPDFKLVFSGESTPHFLTWLNQSKPNDRPHLLILDLLIDRQPSVDVTVVQRLLRAGIRIVVLSALASPALVRQVVQVGVNAVVGKRDSEKDILDALYAVSRGEEWMTPELAHVIAGDPDRPKLSIQEEQALVLYASGLTMGEVAAAMNLSPHTAKQYIDRVKAKYRAAGIHARTQLDLGRIAWKHGYVEPGLAALRV